MLIVQINNRNVTIEYCHRSICIYHSVIRDQNVLNSPKIFGKKHIMNGHSIYIIIIIIIIVDGNYNLPEKALKYLMTFILIKTPQGSGDVRV